MYFSHSPRNRSNTSGFVTSRMSANSLRTYWSPSDRMFGGSFVRWARRILRSSCRIVKCSPVHDSLAQLWKQTAVCCSSNSVSVCTPQVIAAQRRRQRDAAKTPRNPHTIQSLVLFYRRGVSPRCLGRQHSSCEAGLGLQNLSTRGTRARSLVFLYHAPPMSKVRSAF